MDPPCQKKRSTAQPEGWGLVLERRRRKRFTAYIAISNSRMVHKERQAAGTTVLSRLGVGGPTFAVGGDVDSKTIAGCFRSFQVFWYQAGKY